MNYFDFVFYMKVKTKPKYKILNFAFQFIKNTKLHFGYKDLNCSTTSNVISNSQSVSVEVPSIPRSNPSSSSPSSTRNDSVKWGDNTNIINRRKQSKLSKSSLDTKSSSIIKIITQRR